MHRPHCSPKYCWKQEGTCRLDGWVTRRLLNRLWDFCPQPSGHGQWMVQLSFQYLGLRIKSRDLPQPLRIRIVRRLGNQPDNLALRRDRPVVARQFPHRRVDLPHRSRAEVRNVHAHLGAAVHAHPNRLHPVQSASPDERIARAIARAAAISACAAWGNSPSASVLADSR